MEKKKIILIGAGLRGLQYTNIMFDLADRYEVVAVAEPVACESFRDSSFQNDTLFLRGDGWL